MLTRIHVNQHVIKANHKHGKAEPPLTVKDYRRNRRAHTARIMVEGQEVARIVYRPSKPLSCGARCWIETKADVLVE